VTRKSLFYQSKPSMSRHLANVCAVIAAWSLPALAMERPKLMVLPFVALEGAEGAATSKFNALVVEALKKRTDRVEVVGAAPSVRQPGPERLPAAKAPSAQALSALEAGRRAFDDLLFEDAVRDLRSGLDNLLSDPATCDFELVLDAQTKLAVAFFRMGEEMAAKAVLNELARLAPNHDLSPGYPPAFVREFAKAKKRLEKQPKGSISVDGPPGSTVFLDGRDLGMVPVLEEGVPLGLHFVRVEGSKGARFGQTVEVRSSGTKVKAVFAPAAASVPATALPDPRIGASLDEGTRDRVAMYARAAHVEYVVVAGVSPWADGQLVATAALFSLSRAGFSTLAPQIFDEGVLTANTEAFRLSEEICASVVAFGALAGLPLPLASRPKTAVAKPERPNVDPLDVAAPPARRVASLPRDAEVGAQPELRLRVLEHTSTVADDIDAKLSRDDAQVATAEVKSKGIPPWVWVVTGAAVAGAAVGGYFGYRALTTPVTGVVTATW
jgi:hypothetical protein